MNPINTVKLQTLFRILNYVWSFFVKWEIVLEIGHCRVIDTLLWRYSFCELTKNVGHFQSTDAHDPL